MTLQEEKDMRIESGRIAVRMVLDEIGYKSDDIGQAEAFRIFGRANVESWRNSGLIKRSKIGEKNSKVTYSKIELETIRNLCGG